MTSGRYIMSVFTVFFTSAASFFLPHSKLRSAPGVLRAFTCAPPKGVYNMYIYIYISTSGQILFHEQKWSSNEKKKKKEGKIKKNYVDEENVEKIESSSYMASPFISYTASFGPYQIENSVGTIYSLLHPAHSLTVYFYSPYNILKTKNRSLFSFFELYSMEEKKKYGEKNKLQVILKRRIKTPWIDC